MNLSIQALSPEEIADMKKTAGVFKMSPADFVRNAVREYIELKKQEPFYRMTADIEEVDSEEAEELLAWLDSMTEEDHEIVRADYFFVA
mgnify:CR=1 FL=1